MDPWLWFSVRHPGQMVVPQKHLYLEDATDDELELWLIANGYIHFVNFHKARAIIVNWLVVGQKTELLGEI